MPEPLDEDAPMVARVAADAVELLGDATTASVGYPGLAGVRDAEEVLAALARLAEELEATAGHLDGYLEAQVSRPAGVLAGPGQQPAAPVEDARAALRRVREAAREMSELLTSAEAALLRVETTEPD